MTLILSNNSICNFLIYIYDQSTFLFYFKSNHFRIILCSRKNDAHRNGNLDIILFQNYGLNLILDLITILHGSLYIYYVIFYELIHQQCLWLFHSLQEESYFLWLILAGTESFNLFKNNSQLLLLGSMPYTWMLWSRYLLIVRKNNIEIWEASTRRDIEQYVI